MPTKIKVQKQTKFNIKTQKCFSGQRKANKLKPEIYTLLYINKT